MDKTQVKNIIESPLEFDDSNADSYGSMVREAFSKQMRWVMIMLWGWFFIFLVPLIFSVIQFFKTDQTKSLILYATIFILSWVSIGILKLYVLIILQKYSLRREVKRLELCIVKLNETVLSR